MLRFISEFFDERGYVVKSVTPVQGGSINQAFKIVTSSEKLFVKINDSHRYPSMFSREAEGLRALEEGSQLKIPKVLECLEQNGKQYLVLEWLENGRTKNSWKNFGEKMAQMHRKPQQYFGWANDNYIGSLPQKNDKGNNWAEFYSERRIMPLVKILAEGNALNARDIFAAERLCEKFTEFFPSETPSLLHGDLWSGNFMETNKGASVYDPAVYFGHREMDIGMSLLFGGFDPEFYEAYDQTYPLEKDWKKRMPLTQLYPLLVHAVLFGGAYTGSARQIIEKYT